MSQEKIRIKSSIIVTKRKRRLLPLRSHNLDFVNAGRNVDSLDTGLSVEPEKKKIEMELPRGESRKQSGKRPLSRQLRSLVCTFMHRKEVDFVTKSICKLGGFDIEKTVTLRTTHLVCGEEKRTLNMLKAIANGCWLVNMNWVKESLKAGKWLDEEPYELITFPAIKECRIARDTFGGRVCHIFNNSDTYYVASKTSPASSDLMALLQSCGGKVETSSKTASIVISPKALKLPPGIINVTEKWVLDSIVKNMLQDKGRYSPDQQSKL